MISLPCDIPANLRARHSAYVEDPTRENLPSPLDLKNRQRIEAWRKRQLRFTDHEFNRVVREKRAPAGSLARAAGGRLVYWLTAPLYWLAMDLIGPE